MSRAAQSLVLTLFILVMAAGVLYLAYAFGQVSEQERQRDEPAALHEVLSLPQ